MSTINRFRITLLAKTIVGMKIALDYMSMVIRNIYTSIFITQFKPMFYITTWCFVMFGSYESLDALNTLTDITTYVATLPEHPESDDHTYDNPLYRNFHKSLNPVWKQAIHYVIPPTGWSIYTLQSLLDAYLAHSASSEHKEVLTIEHTTPQKVIIFGSLHGALHSFTRDLQQLKILGIINEELIVAPENFIIFNGNAIDYSPYSLEVFTIILQLMLKNPHHVIYLKGEHEDKEFWMQSSLAADLEVRTTIFSYTTKTLTTDIKKIFENFPKILLVRDSLSQNAFVISSLFHNPEDLKRLIGSYQLQALITNVANNKNLTQKKPGHGLYLLSDNDSTPTIWAITSSPIRRNKMLHSIHDDAFSLLTLNAKLQDSTIQNYYHDTRETQAAPFLSSPLFSLISGKQLEQPKKSLDIVQLTKTLCESQTDIEEIFVGCTLDLSREIASMGISMRTGITLCIDHENSRGGIRGRMVKPIFMDDGYSGIKAKENMHYFINTYNSTLTIGSIGTPTLSAYIDMIKEDQLFMFFPVTGAVTFRDKQISNIVHWRSSYHEEGKKLTEYMLQKYKPKSVGLYYQNDDFGISLLNGALETIQTATVSVTKFPYEAKSLTLDKIIQELTQQPPEILGFFGTSAPSSELIRRLPVTVLQNMHLFGFSNLTEIQFENFLRNNQLSMTKSHLVPNIKASTWQLIEKYKTLLAAKEIKSDPFILEGFISAALMIEILRKTPEPLSHENILATIASFKNHDFQGMRLTFNPETHEIAHYLWIESETNEWITIDA